MTQNSIPALRQIASLTETSSSGQRAVSHDNTPKVSFAKSAVSFTVVSATPSQLVLQDNANKQRINIATESLQNIANATVPKSGDTLILVSANDKQINFRLVAGGQEGSTPQNALPAQLNRAVAQGWPDISASALNKAPLNIAAQLKLEAQTTSSRQDPNLASLAKLISQSATSLGRPSIELPIIASIKSLSPAGRADLTAVLNVLMSNGKNIELLMPVPVAKQSLVKVGASIELMLSGNTPARGIMGVSLGNNTLSPNEINMVNKANPGLGPKVTAMIEQALFSGSKNSTSINSKSASQNYAMPLSNKVLSTLPTDFKGQIKNAISGNVLNDAQLLVTNTANTTKGQSSGSPGSILLSAIAKPQIVSIASTAFQTSAQAELKPVANEQLLAQNKEGRKLADTTINAGENTKVTLPNVSTGTKAEASILKLQSDSLLQGIKSNLSPQAFTELPAKLQNAMHHTLSHSAPSAESIDVLKSGLEKIMAQGSAETKQQFAPLLQQLKTFSEARFDSRKAPETQIPLSANILNGSANTAKPDAGAGDNTLKGSNDIAQLIKYAMASEAVTQISTAQNQVAAKGQNSFIEGLVSLLKLSLAANLASRVDGQAQARQGALQGSMLQTSLASFAASLINPAANQNSKQNTKAQPTKLLQDIAKADPRGSLIGEIGKLLSSHNTQKLRSAEASLQGTDTYYYAIPNLLNKDGQDIEIAIRREKEREHTQEDKNESSLSEVWKLDIKLDVGKHGKVLAKTRIQNQALNLHLYASDEALKQRVLKYLPILHARLNALGIEVNAQQCDVGNVEPSLYKTQLNVMHTYA